MRSKPERFEQTAELRRQAEQIAQANAAQWPENAQALSLDEVRQMLHELRVHEIELSMQNEELRRAQIELDAARARYFDLYDLAPVAYLTLSKEGLILEANLTAVNLLGVARGALFKQPIRQFILKKDQDLYYRYRKQLFESGACELRMLKADGTYFWAHLESSVAHEDDAPVSRIVMSDITKRKRAEESLRESEQRHRTILQAAMDGFWLADAQGRLLEVNETYCRMSGYRAQELLAMSIQDMEAGDTARSTASRLQMIMAQGEDRFESRHRRRDGSIFDVEVSVQYQHLDGGWFVFFLRDITGRKRADEEKAKLEAQLQQAQKMESVGRLAGGVAHDFNNMLGVILGRLELAFELVEPAAPLHAELVEIRKAANRSADFTRQLLAFARKQTIAPKVLDLNETVAGMFKMLPRLIGENIHLNWQPKAGLWPVKADPSQIDQILTNLCLNARDAIADVGRITIETGNSTFDDAYCSEHLDFLPGDYVRLVVSDNGCGMDKETLLQIFEPFFTTKDIGKGTGLGLAMTYGAVKQNNGFIHVESEPGSGTTFSVYLPRYVGEAGQTRPEGTSVDLARGQELILLVEDEPSILNVTKRMLEHEGYTVLSASGPSEALRLAREHGKEIHLLLTDVVMPEMNGRELAKALRSLAPHLKCLFMSGYTANAIASHGVLDQGVDFIEKPFSMKDLTAKVRKVLDYS